MKSRLAFRNGTPQTRTFRKFNRFYTALIGTLSRDYLQTRYSLQEARVIYQVASNPCCTAKEIQARTDFDQGYLSRSIARLAEAKLLVGKRSTKDSRAQIFLTTQAEELRLLNDRADDQAHGLTSHLNPEQIQRLCDAFGVIESLLDSTARPEPIIIREQRVGDLGWTFHRQAVVYSQQIQISGPIRETRLPRALHIPRRLRQKERSVVGRRDRWASGRIRCGSSCERATWPGKASLSH